VAYLRCEEDPNHDTVRRLTLVPFLEDGTCIGFVAADGRLDVPSGAVMPGESWMLDAALRLPLEQAGFRMQRVHPFAIDGDHLYVWVDGAGYTGDRQHADVAWRQGSATEVAGWLDDQGSAALAEAVRDAGRSFAAQDEASYYADNLRLLEPAYLQASTPEGGSGSGATPEQWRENRGMIVDGLHRDGSFLDVGCANGLLMESVRAWAAERGRDIEPYGVDLGAGLVALARTRLPQWADRIEVGNAIDYRPGRQFTFVHCLPDAVPPARRGDLLAHLSTLVEPGGRLLVSLYRTALGPGADELVAECGWRADGSSSSASGKHTTAWIEC
jgi:hypothetical protein